MRDSSIAWILILSGLTLLVITTLTPAFATHDYFTPNVVWDKMPNICLVDIPRTDLYTTLKAVHSWEKALAEYTNSTKWNYQMSVTEHNDLANCNVHLTQVNEITYRTNNGDTPVGLTQCFIELSRCFIKIDVTYDDGKQYYNTVVHEVGHAIGLGHRLPVNATGFPAVFISNDIMMPVAKAGYLEISKESLDALIFFYDNYPVYSNYTIPHNDSWRDYENN